MRRLLCLAPLVALACGPSKEKQQARALGAAIEAMIAAPNEQKAAALAAVERAPCEGELACETKRVCVDAFTPLVRAMTIKDEVRAAMRAPGAAASADALRARVDEADALVKETAKKHDLCLAKKAVMQQKLGRD